MNIAMVYIYIPGDSKYQGYAAQFVRSYERFLPEFAHRTIIVCQKEPPEKFALELFSRLPDVTYFQHDNSGHDIGAFQSIAKTAGDEWMLCLSSSSFVQRAGWMKRMAEAADKHGPGFYGVTSTYEVSPHLNTSGVWCPGYLLASYPIKVETKVQRYDFEHGPNAFWKKVAERGYPVKLVTWDGEYDWQDWRKPPNIYRRGNQSNILVYFHHCTRYAMMKPAIKTRMEASADRVSDPAFAGSVNRNEELYNRSVEHFFNMHRLTFGVR
jgi:hypothetical protein